MLSIATEAVSARPPSGSRVNELRCADLLGYEVAADTAEACVDLVSGWLSLRDGARYLACLNPHSAFVASRDAEFNNAIMSAGLVIPDGVGVVWASRLLQVDIRSRVTGFDVFWGLSTILQKRGGGRYFFLGSDEQTLEAINRQMSLQFPSIEVVGMYAPPFVADFTREESVRMIDVVNQAQPDVLWVGLSAPKQEKWVHKHIDELRVPVVAPVGAVFDYFARTKRRPGQLARNLGLEWLVRLCQEPRRLWRRSLISAPVFLVQVATARIRSRGARG